MCVAARQILTDHPELTPEYQTKFDEIMVDADKLLEQIQVEERKEQLAKVEAELKFNSENRKTAPHRPAQYIGNTEEAEQRAFVGWLARQVNHKAQKNFAEEEIERFFNPYENTIKLSLPNPQDKRSGLLVGTQGGGTTGGTLVPLIVPATVEHWLKYYCPLRDYVEVMRTETPRPFNLPVVDATSQLAQIVGEQGAAVETDPAFNKVSFNALTRKWFGVVTIDYELIDSAVIDVVNLVSQLFGEIVGRGQEQAFVTGTAPSNSGTVSGSLAGFAATCGNQTGGAVGSLTLDNVINMQYQIDRAYQRDAAVFMSNKTLSTLRLVKDTNGRYMFLDFLSPMRDAGIESLNGHPIIVTNQLSDFSALGHNIFMIMCPPKLFVINDVKNLELSVNPYLYQANGEIGLFYKWYADSNYKGPTRSMTYLST